jgi:RNA polymerase sigma-70 factor, ECF subfamily
MAESRDVAAFSKYALPRLRLLEDVELAAALRDGCPDALTVLFERHSALIFHIARNIVKDDWEAEETVQQVFFDLFRAIAQFDPERGSFKTWMLQFAYHRSIDRRDHLLCKKFYNSQELNEAIFGGALAGTRSLLQLSTLETTRLIEQILTTLKRPQRRVIELTFFEGLTPEEIAHKLGQTSVVVRNHLYRGLAKLRCALLRSDSAVKLVGAKREGEQERMFVAQPRLL